MGEDHPLPHPRSTLKKHPGKKRGPTGDESSPTSTMLSFRYVSYEPGKGIIFVWTNLINTHQLQLNDPPSTLKCHETSSWYDW